MKELDFIEKEISEQPMGENATIKEALSKIRKQLKVLALLKTQVCKTEGYGAWYIDTDYTCFDTNGEENKLIDEWLKGEE